MIYRQFGLLSYRPRKGLGETSRSQGRDDECRTDGGSDRNGSFGGAEADGAPAACVSSGDGGDGIAALRYCGIAAAARVWPRRCSAGDARRCGRAWENGDLGFGVWTIFPVVAGRSRKRRFRNWPWRFGRWSNRTVRPIRNFRRRWPSRGSPRRPCVRRSWRNRNCGLPECGLPDCVPRTCRPSGRW